MRILQVVSVVRRGSVPRLRDGEFCCSCKGVGKCGLRLGPMGRSLDFPFRMWIQSDRSSRQTHTMRESGEAEKA